MANRIITSIVALCALLTFSSPPDSCADFKKTKIAVLDFVLKGDAFTTQDMGGIVAEWFTTSLVQDGRFEVVERALLQKIVEEQKLGMTGLIDESSTTEIGKILGVKTIITGSVLQLGRNIEVNARIINVRTGSIVAAENVRSTTRENLRSVIEQLTRQIVKNFPLTGYIVKVRGDEVLIDLGAASGLQVGMEFMVFKEGEVIKHPKTGEVLEVEQIKTGQIRITDIGGNIATARIEQTENGQKVEYGQLVQSIRRTAEPPSQSGTYAMPQLAATRETSSQSAKPHPSATGYTRSPESEGERDNLASGGLGPAMKLVPTGTYMMGSNSFSEKPQHFVNIDHSILMAVSEITFADYEKFCLDTARSIPDDAGWGRQDRPVINISWQDAQDYTTWLSEQTGATYRLPYENEWEWAAGAGKGTMYPWGNDFRDGMANCRNCDEYGKRRQTAPTRSYPPNHFGLHDMVGNVWEWVEDCWKESYRDAPDTQSARSYSGRCGNYTIRGGAWNSPVRQLTVTSRLGIWAATRSNYIGFRVVKDAASQGQATVKAAAGSSSQSSHPTSASNRSEKKSTTTRRIGSDWDEEGR